MSLSFATYMQRKAARIALPDSTAAAAAVPNSYNFSGSINGAYEIGCEMQKKRIECAIMIKAALADEE